MDHHPTPPPPLPTACWGPHGLDQTQSHRRGSTGVLTTSVSLVGHSRGGGEGDTEDPGKVGAQATAKAGLCISVCVRWGTWGL